MLLWNALSLVAVAHAATHEAGETYFGRNDYIEYRAGNLPIILTSGHGGDLTPAEIPDRTWGVFARDTNTRPLTQVMAEEITRRTGKYPHVVISHLHRRKLDPNREIIEAAQGNAFAEIAWHEYHGFIQSARAAAEAEFGFGFVTDIHGHGHEIQRIELGYGLGDPELNLSNAQLEAPGFGWNSSLRTLMLRRPGVSFPELLRGPRSLGDLLNDRGVPAWPSSLYPGPGGAPFFNGGYTTRQHTCFIDNGPINGVQLEFHWTGVRDTAANRSAMAANFARVIQPYLYENYGYSIGTLPLHTLHTASREIEKGGPPIEFQIVREGFNDFSGSMEIELGGSAVHGSDYLVSNSIVHFSSGQAVATFSLLPRIPNGEIGDKTIEIRLAPTYRQTADLTPVVLTLGDGFSQTVRIGARTPAVLESDGLASFRLWRTSTDEALTVNLEWAGTAIPGLDYDFPWKLPESVRFPAGVAEVDVVVELVNDVIPEPDKQIVLRILAGDNYEIGYPAEASVQLIDDDAPHGLVAWFRGEIEQNRLLDSSGHQRHATTLPAGRGPTSVSTPQGPAIAFDGLEAAAALPKFTLDSTGGFSIAFHFRIDSSSPTSQHNFISFGPRGGAGSLNVYLNSSTSLRTWLGSSSASSLDATGIWMNGSWRHYALTVDGTGMSRVFIDGRSVQSRSGWVGPLDPNEILWLGWRRARADGSEFFGGAIRDFRVYDRALAPSEVAGLAIDRLTFDAWLRQRNLPVGAPASADLDGDGMNLLHEYALGADPLVPGRAPRYEIRRSGDNLILDFVRQASARDITWRVEASADPSLGWETLAERLPHASAWALAPGVTLQENQGLISVRDSEPAPQVSRRFMRLHMELAHDEE